MLETTDLIRQKLIFREGHQEISRTHHKLQSWPSKSLQTNKTRRKTSKYGEKTDSSTKLLETQQEDQTDAGKDPGSGPTDQKQPSKVLEHTVRNPDC